MNVNGSNISYVWLDSDGGCDDCCGLLLLLQCNNIKILGISTVFGNVNCSQAYHNILVTLKVLGHGIMHNNNDNNKYYIPIYKGCSESLVFNNPIEMWIGH